VGINGNVIVVWEEGKLGHRVSTLDVAVTSQAASM